MKNILILVVVCFLIMFLYNNQSYWMLKTPNTNSTIKAQFGQAKAKEFIAAADSVKKQAKASALKNTKFAPIFSL